MSSADTFSTVDLYTSAFLVTTGYPVRKTTRDDTGRVVLHFDSAAATRAMDFECGAAQVDARLFASAHRMLKVRIARELKAR